MFERRDRALHAALQILEIEFIRHDLPNLSCIPRRNRALQARPPAPGTAGGPLWHVFEADARI
jgi:hypothetical protein